ncbi:hypothetical protein IFT48_02425 [Pseudomonas fluorescens]|uniref:hypothetical protein n=1 Tax=Pseudomonas TaxID=286 RepID=UPI00177C4985|nr:MULTISPECIES: hypothetical protein [Pseudomonas]MBD8088820.1 hypothetical protein [Pseudomonas fluorescens]MBD8614715.1 hypothetical protein [Pseudomonas putida]MBD8681601.1 hypothetical protein [Pseudomonas sp. CFBP 13719]
MTSPLAKGQSAVNEDGTQTYLAEDKVWWHYASCKAYTPKKIPAVVLWTGKTRIRIEFALWVREEWVKQVRTVAHTNLSPRDENCHGIDQFHPSKAIRLAA